jgi:glycosyltransferase involved in cell wall biosynthesis
MISVIIPCYNVENYITGCLDSLYHQTSQDFQLILVDDASTDGTLAKIKEYPYLKEFKEFELVELSDNNGVSNARNVGISKVKGGYFVLVDGDDCLEKETIQTISDAILKNNADVIGFDVYLVGIDGSKKVLRLGSSSLKEQMSMAIRGYWSTVWRFAYKTEFIRNNKFQLDTNLTCGEDYLFVCQVLSKVKSFCKIGNPLYSYATDNAGSAMKKVNIKGLSDQIEATNKVAYMIEADNALRSFNQDLNYRYLYIKKLFFKTSLKIWRSWNPQSNSYIGGGNWRLEDRLVFKVISLLSKGLK